MNRSKFLWMVVALLGLGWLGIWISAWWGTVTLEFENQPLGKVLDAFQRQTKLPIITDLDRSQPTTIRVRRVAVTEALEAIQASADVRGGRLACLLAADSSGLDRIRTLLPRPPEESGLLTFEYRIPFPAMASLEELPVWSDPRSQIWEPQPGVSRDLRSLAQDAAQAAEIRIYLAGDWNPTLSRIPRGGALRRALPSLAKLATGRAELVYVLTAPRPEERRDGPEPVAPSSWSSAGEGRRRTASLPPESWIRRLEGRISGLPPAEAASARSALAEAARSYQDWDNLTPEQRREKVQALMQDPAAAERMGDRFSRGLRRMSPEQRSQRYQGYVERREQAKTGSGR